MWPPPVSPPPDSRDQGTLRGSPLLARGRLGLANGPRRVVRGLFQELAHAALRDRPGAVLWCDGDHGFNPYDFAEWNLEHGEAADWGAERVLIKRCMTPFQWDTVLTQHLDQKLLETETALVLVAPYDRLFSTDELADWEQEDYVRYSLKHLRRLARRHNVPVLLAIDMATWWRTHTTLAKMAYEAADARWNVQRSRAALRATNETSGETIRVALRRIATLYDFEDETGIPATTPSPRPRRRARPRWF